MRPGGGQPGAPGRPGAFGVGRAPRLGPDDRLAPYLTRVGRFRAVDPLTPRDRASIPRLLGVVGWVALLLSSFSRARRAARASAPAA